MNTRTAATGAASRWTILVSGNSVISATVLDRMRDRLLVLTFEFCLVSSVVGKHDGIVRGKRYFTCPPRHGIFVRADIVQAMNPYLASSS
jgi:hypothetical protein